MLSSEDSLVLIIDFQEKLVRATGSDNLIGDVVKLVKAAQILELPMILTEQYPKGLGETVYNIKTEVIEKNNILEKTDFSAFSTPNIFQKIKDYNRKNIILCGIETHICVYQTCLELLEAGYNVYIVSDLCASRDAKNSDIGLNLMQNFGAKLTSLEIVLFELLKSSKHAKFKEIQTLIK